MRRVQQDGRGIQPVLHHKDLTRAVVAKHIRAGWQARPRATIDVASYNRAPPQAVCVFRDRRYMASRRSAHSTIKGGIANTSLHDSPAVVSADRYYIYLFARSLPDIGNIELARAAIKREPKRIAKPIRINFI